MRLIKKYFNLIRNDVKTVMMSRCGQDELNNLLMLIGFVNIVIALWTGKGLFSFIATVFVVMCYMRVFSKRIEKRRHENAIYMKYMGKIVRKVEYWMLSIKMTIKTMNDSDFAYCVCANCRQYIRVPKGKRKLKIRCPRCGDTFVKKL